MHNSALEDLRRLAFFVLQVLEAERQRVRHPATAEGARNGAHHAGQPPQAAAAGDLLEELASEAPADLASGSGGRCLPGRVRGQRAGLPDGAEEAVFEPLFSRKEGGRGMGLTMARQLLESHGGSITAVVDGRRKGAHFVLTLPRKRARATIY